MIRLCLFDLDQTLVDTDDMKDLREAGKHRNDAAYAGEVQQAYRSHPRSFIAEIWLTMLKHENPGMKLGIFTRSPRRYVNAILATVYPQLQWDAAITYEDVQNYKPNGEGIYRAMATVGLTPNQVSEVMLVGDSDVDLRAAYHAGCHALLFSELWPARKEPTHWRSLNLLADVVMESTLRMRAAIANPIPHLPDLERLLASPAPPPPGGTPRFDEIGKFYPNDRTRHVINAAGRYFPFHPNLDSRRAWHLLSQSIQANKESVVFPAQWVETVKRFIAHRYQFITANPFNPELVITAIPARPGRVHRLGHLIAQIQTSYGDNPRLNRLRLTFDPNVLAYRPGVQSQSHDHLTQEERFANVRDHLFVVNPAAAQGRKFLVLDDVSTSGATLLYARKYLTGANATSVDCFSLAQTISDPLRQL